MAHGAGKYDVEATELRDREHAAGVLVIVLGGKQGGGFSVCGIGPALVALPRILRDVAGQIEADAAAGFAGDDVDRN